MFGTPARLANRFTNFSVTTYGLQPSLAARSASKPFRWPTGVIGSPINADRRSSMAGRLPAQRGTERRIGLREIYGHPRKPPCLESGGIWAGGPN
jgi:hypothetical protein